MRQIRLPVLSGDARSAGRVFRWRLGPDLRPLLVLGSREALAELPDLVRQAGLIFCKVPNRKDEELVPN